MHEEIERLIKKKDICVLATASEGAPYCSLMNYVPSNDCTEIYMVTQRGTKKYKNLNENNSVSLLVDTREEHPGPLRPEGKAITITGVFQKIEEENKKTMIRSKFLEKHPYLNIFIEDKDSDIFCVKVSSFLLLDGFTNAHFEQI
jgi:nitroimidazol reductase NimA-like FMN-containing flavoprotein (pyridoxamine 5'-phosphate oxidase superfamily)